jgi:predicted RNA-binding Zn-ribbon protein involved in translation (DUF1610 family)
LAFVVQVACIRLSFSIEPCDFFLMSIDFRCGSIVEFDATQKKYLTCDEKLSVDPSQAGMMVECPACGNHVEVPYADVRPTASSFVAESGQTAASSSSANQNEGTYRLREELIQNIPVREKPATAKPALQTAQFTRGNTCARCGANIQQAATACPACKMLLPADVRRENRTLEPKHKLTGFQLWCSNLIVPESRQAAMFAFATLQLIAGMLVFCFAVFLMFYLGILGMLLTIPLILLVVMYVQVLFSWRQMVNNPLARPTWWLRFSWVLLLYFNRLFSWSNPFEPGRVFQLLDKRHAALVSDHDLHDMEGIEKAQILDLENQPISDQGLLYLHKRHRLRYIVLRKTHVTDEGVFHLQQALPKTWIWHW